ncbi:cupin domain-containing protein [Halodesulfovibrio marinisediminis]|uniref:Cupin domain protein n=1 Tax=Halodesulfovibrio marinisediminis DSM 17456 TaxID=1121457 RepID=A0A1N6I7D5_9BACT|nr:cupin domain-containing protein [Halodesulfovibrio marinisediminis]SIO27931.1 Cupin domain protein [Halodesulfovibrio marinisediminis DSM 17456]
MNDSTIANNTVYFSHGSKELKDIAWVDHPTFKGVQLKHLLTSEETGNIFSSHLIKIAPQCGLENHCHENQKELHEIMAGHGECVLTGKTICYKKGVMTVIEKGEPHQVKADEQGLLLLAKFFPPLV